MESIAILIVAMAVAAIVASGTQIDRQQKVADLTTTAPVIQTAGQTVTETEIVLRSDRTSEQELPPAELTTNPVPEKFRQDLKGFIVLADSKKRLTEEETDLIIDSVWEHGNKYDIDPILLASLIYRESSFYPKAVSRSGAIGLGQLLPSTARNIGLSNPYDIEQNIQGTAFYLKQLMDSWAGYKRQISLALASYKEGISRVKSRSGSYTGHTQKYINDIFSACNRLAPDRY